MEIAILVAGLVLLLVGGEFLVRGGVSLAARLGVSQLAIGLVVLSTCTSLPELFVSLDAVLRDQPDIAVGNVVGSNIANILLILGVGALIRALPTSPGVLLRDGLAMLGASVVFVYLLSTGSLSRIDGIVLLALLALYLTISWIAERDSTRPEHAEAAAETETVSALPIALVLLAFGAALLVFGAQFAVNGAIGVARIAGLSEASVSLVIIAVGTSLPELGATIVAALRGRTQLVVGNAIGSNIFNILAIMGTTAAAVPFGGFSPALGSLDAMIMLAVAALILPMMLLGWRVGRTDGVILLAAYVVYIGFIGVREGLIPNPF